eukprot:11937907-Alexandrium_andersonii.AAC.1
MHAALQDAECCQVCARHCRDFAGVLDGGDCLARRAPAQHHEHGANNCSCPVRTCAAVDDDAFVVGYG